MDHRTSGKWPNNGTIGADSDAAFSFATYLFEHTSELAAAVDTQLRLVGLNAAFHREFELVFGKKVALGERLDDILGHVPGDRERANALCRRALAGESFRTTEAFGDERLLRKTYELAFSPILNTEGQALLAGIVVRDLSMEQVNAQRFDALLEAAPDAMLIMRADGVIDRANASAERMFRYKRRLTGIHIEELLPERFRHAHLAHRARFFEHPATRPMGGTQADLWGLRADGSEFPVEISLNPLQVDHGRMVVAAIRDMTMRQNAEDRLRQLSVDLEERVAERTTALEKANRELTERIRVQQMAEAALAEYMAEFRATFEQAAVGIAHVAPDGRWLRLNRQLTDIVGYSYDELLGLTFHNITHPDDIDTDVDLRQQLLDGELPSYSIEKRFLHKNGNVIWINQTVSLALYANGAPRYFIAVVQDIDVQKKAKTESLQRRAHLKAVLDNLSEGVVVFDVDGNVLDMNPAALRMHGYATLDEALQALPDYASQFKISLLDGTTVPVSDWPLVRVARGESLSNVELVISRFDSGHEWIANYSGSLIVGEADAPTIGVLTVRDITVSKQAEEGLRQAGLHDLLTGLPNRALLFEFADHLFSGNSRSVREAGILFIDLDRFKQINDTHGHEAGDVVLQEVSRRLKRNIRHGDFAFRFGGDEFLVLLPEINNGTDAAEVSRHIASSLNKPFCVGALELTLAASIGISIYPRDGEDIDTLIKRADAAMYQAKDLGGNNGQFYSPELAARANALTTIEQQLRAALAHKDFRLFYQPVIDMKTAALVSVEALLRWPHRETGPDRFVPVAEATGLIDRLGDWVICEACRQHNAWCAHGLPAIPIAVNVSAVQFRRKDFVERFEQTMHDCKVVASALQLEVTETVMIEDPEHAIEVLIKLRALGIKILLDDFGTGYSSLSYLSRLPIDKIKVDKSFIHHIENDTASRAITDAIIALGQTLNLEVVAEGIESNHELDYLRRHGCSHAQGFLVCAPVAADDFESWYRKRVETAR